MLEGPSDIEDRYFLQQEIEQRAKLREKLAAEAEALRKDREIAKSAGTEDAALAERIRRLGFDGETVKVLDLLPLVHVAWADGTVQHSERALILHLIEERDLGKQHPATHFIESVLEHKPSLIFMEESLEVLHDLLKDKGKSGAAIVDLCAKVGESAGGMFGLGGEISHDERRLIEHIAKALGDKAVAEFNKLLG